MKKLLLAVSVISLVMQIYNPCIAQTFSSFSFEGLVREYIYYAPKDLTANSPLVFVLHGYSSNGIEMSNYTSMDSIANKYRFAVCYPNGTKDNRGKPFWNVGYSFTQDATVNDTGFLVSLAKYLQTKHQLDPLNTFVTGFSNGGEMSFTLACVAPKTFRAAAPVSGEMFQYNNISAASNTPIPMFIIHGTKDEINYYDGDTINKGGWGTYPGIPVAVNYFVERNKCATKQMDTLPDLEPDDDNYIISEKHLHGINNTEVWLYKIVGGGHSWPGTDESNKDINASEEIWLFFERFLTGSPETQ